MQGLKFPAPWWRTGRRDDRLTFAYADPPYIGQAKKHYYCEEIDHAELIARLNRDYDGWALSCSSPTLRQILSLCPDDVRIGAWVKPFCSFKKNVNPAYAWEPVIFRGIRKRGTGKHIETERDWCAESITLRKGLSGVKPLGFCYWLFDLVGLKPEDEFHDLFPGSGAVTKAWEMWRGTRAGEKGE